MFVAVPPNCPSSQRHQTEPTDDFWRNSFERNVDERLAGSQGSQGATRDVGGGEFQLPVAAWIATGEVRGGGCVAGYRAAPRSCSTTALSAVAYPPPYGVRSYALPPPVAFTLPRSVRSAAGLSQSANGGCGGSRKSVRFAEDDEIY